MCLAVLGLTSLASWLTDSHAMGFLERALILSQILWLMIALRISRQFGLTVTSHATSDVEPQQAVPELQLSRRN